MKAGSSIALSILSMILRELVLLLVAHMTETSSEKLRFSSSIGKGVIENLLLTTRLKITGSLSSLMLRL
jgi:hypothetical protein